MLKHCAILTLAVTLVANADPVEDRVTTIREWYTDIQASKPIDGRKIEFESAVDAFVGTAQIREFDDGLASVHVSYAAGDHGGADEYFYFRNGELFFVFEVESYWKFDPEKGTPEQPATLDTRIENRYYYESRRCVRQLSRRATSSDTTKLAQLTAKVENQVVKPSDDAVEFQKRGGKLFKATTAGDILDAFGISN